MEKIVDINSKVWRNLYSQGKNDLLVPNDVFVRCARRYLNLSAPGKVLEYGFGTGANLIYLAQLGFEMAGVEISEHAVAKTQQRLQEKGVSANLELLAADEPLPYETNTFDAVVAWQVLCYNDWESWHRAVKEIKRVLKSGGIFIGATAAPGDVSHQQAKCLGNSIYESNVEDQEGCILLIPKAEELPKCFPDERLIVGEFSYTIETTKARHWTMVFKNS